MIREEQAKKDCTIVVSDDMEYGTPFATGYNKGIEAGVEWADSHHNWHKYPDEKPQHKGSYLIVRQQDRGICIANFIPNNNVWFGITLDPIAWMELPEPPKFN